MFRREPIRTKIYLYIVHNRFFKIRLIFVIIAVVVKSRVDSLIDWPLFKTKTKDQCMKPVMLQCRC